jgi:hypothetical protein
MFLLTDFFVIKTICKCYAQPVTQKRVQKRERYGMKVKVSKDRKVIKLKSTPAYTIDNKLLMKVTDTGNGYIAYCPSWNFLDQDEYICMNYAQAHELYIALKEFGVEGWD